MCEGWAGYGINSDGYCMGRHAVVYYGSNSCGYCMVGHAMLDMSERDSGRRGDPDGYFAAALPAKRRRRTILTTWVPIAPHRRVGEVANPGPSHDGLEEVLGEMDQLAGDIEQEDMVMEGASLLPQIEETSTLGQGWSGIPILELFAQVGEDAWDEYIARITRPAEAAVPRTRWQALGTPAERRMRCQQQEGGVDAQLQSGRRPRGGGAGGGLNRRHWPFTYRWPR